jgi:hypothetical protein
MSMTLSRTRGLTNAAVPVGGKGHDTGDLLDVELLAWPAKTFAQDTDRRHDGSAWAADIHAGGAAAPTPLSAAASPSAARPTRLARGGAVELGLDQALRIVAIRLVELPASGKIHAGGRRLRKLFGRACRKTNHCQNPDESHAAILI